MVIFLNLSAVFDKHSHSPHWSTFSLPALSRYDWHVTLIGLRCTTWRLDSCIYCKIVITVIYLTYPSSYITAFCVYMIRTFRLTLFTTLKYIIKYHYLCCTLDPQNLIPLVTGNLHPLTKFSEFPPSPSTWQPPFYYFYEFDF